MPTLRHDRGKTGRFCSSHDRNTCMSILMVIILLRNTVHVKCTEKSFSHTSLILVYLVTKHFTLHRVGDSLVIQVAYTAFTELLLFSGDEDTTVKKQSPSRSLHSGISRMVAFSGCNPRNQWYKVWLSNAQTLEPDGLRLSLLCHLLTVWIWASFLTILGPRLFINETGI